MQEHRLQEVREVLGNHIYPGEEFRVRWEDERLEVVPLDGRSALVQDDDELYGLLLVVNERISNAGTGLAFVGLGLTAFVVLSIAFTWFPNITGSLDELRSWWFYAAAGLAGLVVTGWLTGMRERVAFRASERELDRELDRARISRYALLAMIKDDDELDSLTEMLKAVPSEE